MKEANLSSFHKINFSKIKIVKNPKYQRANFLLKKFSQDFDIHSNNISTVINVSKDYYRFILAGNEQKVYKEYKINHKIKNDFDLAYETGEWQYPEIYKDGKDQWLSIIIPLVDSNGKTYAIYHPRVDVNEIAFEIKQSTQNSLFIPILVILIFFVILWFLLSFLFLPFIGIF